MRRRSYETAEAFTRGPTNEAERLRRERRIASGFCAKARSHGAPLPGKTKCEACTRKQAARDRAHHIDSMKRRRSA
jgi:hypothetical protein